MGSCCCRAQAQNGTEFEEDSERSTRDIIWAVLFIAFWAGSWSYSSLAIQRGDPGLLLYGLDYDGNVCNRNQAGADLDGFGNRYWLNPNEVIAASGYGFSLADAASICLDDCPLHLPNNTLSWVCKYPKDRSGTNVDPKQVPNVAAWEKLGYNYFPLLNTTSKQSSCQLKGPCYPVLTVQTEFFTTCRYTVRRCASLVCPRWDSGAAVLCKTLNNVPTDPAAVNALKQCQSCCTNASQATCKFPVFHSSNPVPYNPSVSSQFTLCMSACEDLHGSFSDLQQAGAASIDPVANALFRTTCSALGGFAAVPQPATQDGSRAQSALAGIASSRRSWIQRYLADLIKCFITIIVCGFGLPVVFSFLWLAVLRYFAAALAWATVIGANLSGLVVTLFCFYKAGRLSGVSAAVVSLESQLADSGKIGAGVVSGFGTLSNVTQNALSTTEGSASAVLLNYTKGNTTLITTTAVSSANISQTDLYYLGIALAVITSLLFLCSLVLLPRIRVAVATLEVACECLGDVPQLAFLPFGGIIATGLFLVWWVTILLFVYSSGRVTKRDCCASVQAAWNDLYPPSLIGNSSAWATPPCASIRCGFDVTMSAELEGNLVYHVFSLFWNTQFFIGFTVCVIAHVSYRYYAFLCAKESPAPDPQAALPKWPISRASWVVFRFYFGSVALGSWLVSWVQFIQFPLRLIASRLKAAHQRQAWPPGIMFLIDRLYRALNLVVRLVHSHSYCMLIITGKPYCEAGFDAVKLLLENLTGIEVVTVIADIVLFLGKLAVSASCAFWCFVYIESLPEGSVTSPLLPVILVALASFAVACIFFAVPELIVETTMLTFSKSMAETPGGVDTFCPKVLREAINEHGSNSRGWLAQRCRCCCGGGESGAGDNHHGRRGGGGGGPGAGVQGSAWPGGRGGAGGGGASAIRDGGGGAIAKIPSTGLR